MPPEWMDRLTCQNEEPLWTAGWIPLEPQEQRSQQHPYQKHGCWTALEPLAPQPYNGWAFALGAAPSSYDERSEMWVFGYCVHTIACGRSCAAPGWSGGVLGFLQAGATGF